MFKPPRVVPTWRAFSTCSRARSSFRPSVLNRDGDVRIQRVHVKEGRSKKASKRVLLQASLWAFFWFFVLDSPGIDTPWKKASAEEKAEEEKAIKRGKGKNAQEIRHAKEEEVKEGEEEDVDVPEEMPEDAIFIPLGLAHKKPKEFYKGTDPDWQSFVDFSKDRKRTQLIRNELAGLIGKHISAMKNFQKQLGQPIQTRKFWLDIDFPDGPPPEYERSGIEIADDYIAWTTRPVDAIQISRLQSALWPKPVAVSLWSSYSTLWSLQLARAKEFLGIKPDDQLPGPSTTQMIDFQKLANTKDKQDHQTSPGFDDGEETTNTDPAPPPNPPPKAAPAEDVSKMSAAKQRLHNLGILGTMQDFGTALHVFQHSLIRTWKMPHAPPERGSIMVSGLVELVGSKATCVLDVRAAYHPKENRWVAIGIGVRRLQARKQAPRGGT